VVGFADDAAVSVEGGWAKAGFCLSSGLLFEAWSVLDWLVCRDVGACVLSSGLLSFVLDWFGASHALF